jgi:hypothetical protein
MMIAEPTVHIILALANEEVPVNAIARAVGSPSDEVRETIKEAMLYGRVLSMPRSDWHPLQRGNRGPMGKMTEEELIFNCQRTFKLTHLQACFLSVLMRRNEVGKEALHNIIENCRGPSQKAETDVKMVDVVLCHLRKRVKPFGLVVKTLHSSGYYMVPEMRKMAQDILLAALNGGTDGQENTHKEGSRSLGAGDPIPCGAEGQVPAS